MANRVIRNSNFLKSLIKIKQNKRNELINKATSDQIKSINESILNIVNKNVPICHKKLKKLEPYKNILKKLVYKKPCVKNTKKILLQHGGFLGTLIPIVLSFLANKL